MKPLLEAGVHFGHQTRRWNPKMARFIFMDRNGIHIIDLQQTVTRLNEAYKFVEQLAAQGGTILFVGTKKQAQEAVAEEARRCGMYYVNQRWLGGMLTNFQTIQLRIRYLRELEAQQKDAEPQEVEEEPAGEPVSASPAAETEDTSLPVPVENKLEENLETAAEPELVAKEAK